MDRWGLFLVLGSKREMHFAAVETLALCGGSFHCFAELRETARKFTVVTAPEFFDLDAQEATTALARDFGDLDQMRLNVHDVIGLAAVDGHESVRLTEPSMDSVGEVARMHDLARSQLFPVLSTDDTGGACIGHRSATLGLFEIEGCSR